MHLEGIQNGVNFSIVFYGCSENGQSTVGENPYEQGVLRVVQNQTFSKRSFQSERRKVLFNLQIEINFRFPFAFSK